VIGANDVRPIPGGTATIDIRLIYEWPILLDCGIRLATCLFIKRSLGSGLCRAIRTNYVCFIKDTTDDALLSDAKDKMVESIRSNPRSDFLEPGCVFLFNPCFQNSNALFWLSAAVPV